MKKLLFTLFGIMQVVLVMAQAPATLQNGKLLPAQQEASSSVFSVTNNFLETQAQQLWVIMFLGYNNFRDLARVPQLPQGIKAAVSENSHQEK